LLGSWRQTFGVCASFANRSARAPHVVVLQKYNTRSSMPRATTYGMPWISYHYIPGRQLIHRIYTITCIVAKIQQHQLFRYGNIILEIEGVYL